MLEDAFLQDIVNNPEDEAVRLIYADWLEEQGNPRGEFIRVQCQLARWAGDSTDWREWAMITRNLKHLRQREKALLAEHAPAWKTALGVAHLTVEFRRGFVERLQISPKEFVQRGMEYRQRMPLREVDFFRRDLPMIELAACPLLERLSSVTFSRHLSNSDLAAFVSSSHLRHLERLTLMGTLIGDLGVQALAESPLFAQMTALDLRSCRITIAGLRALLESSHWGRLRHLDFRENYEIRSSELDGLVEEMGAEDEVWRLQALLFGEDSRDRALSNRFARQLAEEAGASEADAAAVLGQALAAPQRRRREAAASMLGRMGEKALPHLAALVRRLHEGRGMEDNISDRAAGSLARLAPLLSEELRTWLGIVANPLREARDNLYSAVAERRLPVELLEPFVALYQRRAAWWRRVSNMEPVPAPRSSELSWQELQQLLTEHVLSVTANRNEPRRAGTVRTPGAAAAEKEAGWLLARLWELLQQHYLKT